MAVRPTLLRDFDSLLQRLKYNNEVTWIICNLSFADYRSLFGLIESLLIKYNFAAPLILHQNLLNLLSSRKLNSHPCSTSYLFFSDLHTHTFFTTWISLYIYLSVYSVGSNNLENNSLQQSAEIQILINLLTGRPSTINSVQKLIPVLTDWARLIQRISWSPSVAEWTR